MQSLSSNSGNNVIFLAQIKLICLTLQLILFNVYCLKNQNVHETPSLLYETVEKWNALKILYVSQLPKSRIDVVLHILVCIVLKTENSEANWIAIWQSNDIESKLFAWSWFACR